MKTIIAGSRNITSRGLVVRAIKQSGFDITSVVEGGARGVDSLAGEWARSAKIPCTTMRPDYLEYDKWTAPKKRNQRMADVGEALIAVWDGVSGGTLDMIRRAHKKGIPFHLMVLRNGTPAPIEDHPVALENAPFLLETKLEL